MLGNCRIFKSQRRYNHVYPNYRTIFFNKALPHGIAVDFTPLKFGKLRQVILQVIRISEVRPIHCCKLNNGSTDNFFKHGVYIRYQFIITAYCYSYRNLFKYFSKDFFAVLQLISHFSQTFIFHKNPAQN